MPIGIKMNEDGTPTPYATTVSFKAEVTTAGDYGQYSSNALRFATREEAESYAYELSIRWTAVRDWRVIESTDPVTEGTQLIREFAASFLTEGRRQ